MKDKIKKFIDNELTESNLKLEATNRFYDYYDDEDIEEYGDGSAEEFLIVINAYGGEEIPGDINEQIYKEIFQKFDYDMYNDEGGEEIQRYIIEKLRVVYPSYYMYHDMEMARLKEQQDLMNKIGSDWD